MNGQFISMMVTFLSLVGLTACTSKPQHKYNNSTAMTPHEKTDSSCSFSSFHRKYALGYEVNETQHISFSVSPKINVLKPSDAEIKFGLRLTKAFGGAANKRPQCTYGSGYYGYLAYLTNNNIRFDHLINRDNLRSYLKDRIEAREQRRKQNELK